MQRIREFVARLRLQQAPQLLRKIVVAVIGTTVLLIGLALVVLPGPAVIVIPIGFAILASEFIWARRVIKRGRILVGRVRRVVKGTPAR
ncbi:MAG TPA: PGPGW domain-containing protein [Chthoniobacterales bacterium]|nr:PGPGW domain-containing protein [Chthoniobacterales bacterium]